jgi:D-beta-D-heptose 7-phosphate kinase/D-beta-D-heptose 1-phosphate adenosyltransferase
MPQQKQFKVLLIGDSCIDEYVYGTCERINPEAPVPILKYTKKEIRQGMAWNVRENLRSFGVEVYMLTNEEKIIKTRYIDEKYNHQILRVDSETELRPIRYELPTDKFDALVISDYDKGFITKQKLFELVDWFDGPVFIDSKKTVLPVDSAFIKINEDEYNRLKYTSPNLIVTLGSKGAEYQEKIYPAEKVSVFDVVGAGDTFFATLVYFYLVYGKIEKAIPFANKAAAIAVQNLGTYVLKEKDVSLLCGY